MKKFEFRLQSLLQLKEQEEEVIKKELATLQRRCCEVEEEIDNLREEKYCIQLRIEKEEEEEIDLNSACNYRRYIRHLKEQIEELLIELNYWEEEIADCRGRLLEKTKEKKALVKLKEEKYKEHWNEFLAQEQKVNDEIATSRFIRRQQLINK